MPLILVTPYRLKKIVEAISQAGYAIWDSLTKPTDVSFHENDLTVTTSASTQSGAQANIGMTSGKWYWEVTYAANSFEGYPLIGVGVKDAHRVNNPIVAQAVLYYSQGDISGDGGWLTNNATGYVRGDTIGVAFDADTKMVTFYKNGNSRGTYKLNIPASTPAYPTVADGGGTAVGAYLQANFGQLPFKFAVPAGFNAGLFEVFGDKIFALFDTSSVGSGATVDATRLIATTSTSQTTGARADIGVYSGKHYIEYTILRATNARVGVGVVDAHLTNTTVGPPAKSVTYDNVGRVFTGTTFRGVRGSLTDGDVVGVLINRDANTIQFYVNGNYTADPYAIPSLAVGEKVYPFVTDYEYGMGTAQVAANFGQKPFKYPVPAGYNEGLYLKLDKGFALWDSTKLRDGATLNASSLSVTTPIAQTAGAQSTVGKSSGKWYWEVTFNSGDSPLIGVGLENSQSFTPVTQAKGVFYYVNGYISNGNGWSMGSAYYGPGDTIGIALNADTKEVTFYKNGVMQRTLTRFGSTPSDVLYAVVADGSTSGSAVMTANFGATPFKYPVPQGYNAGLKA